jgi:hypothetical protein
MDARDDVVKRVGGEAAIGAAVAPCFEDAAPKPLLIESLRDK